MIKPKHDRDTYPYRYKRSSSAKDKMVSIIVVAITISTVILLAFSKTSMQWVDEVKITREFCIILALFLLWLFFIYKPSKRN